MELFDIPTFDYTKELATYCISIESSLRDISSIRDRKVRMRLRKVSRLKSIHSSLAIESNGMSIESMGDVISGKTVEGLPDEVVEVRNASEAYRLIGGLELHTVESFLRIEGILMFGLVPENGFRTCSVGVFNGEVCEYAAPPAESVPAMMERLFEWSRRSGYPAYIVGAILHFYIEMIHPLRDGNGRIGRLWHNAVMSSGSKAFNLISVEDLIYENQEEYYAVLKRAQTDMDCTEFVTFCLRIISERLGTVSRLSDPSMSILVNAMGDEFMSAAEIMGRMGLSSRYNFLKNYLRPAVECGLVEMSDPGHPNNSRQKYRSILY